MTILVTGGKGQVASALGQLGGERVRLAGRPEFDFDHPETIERLFCRVVPRVVVNAAAYTAVDAAEVDLGAAFRANAEGPGFLARLCNDAGVPLIHISTDYVFDGRKASPYVESDPVAPQGAYGASKLAGEDAVLKACERAMVVRTAWVYAPAGKNFVLTMLNAAKTMPRLRVVADQVGCPTAAGDLAAALLRVVDQVAEWRPEYRGIFHAASAGSTSWHGFAVALFEEASRYGVAVPEIAAIATADWPTPAKRPANSRLDCAKLERVFGVRLPEWRDGLRRTVEQIFRNPG